MLTFTAGPTHNDTTAKLCFPYVQTPWPGFTGAEYSGPQSTVLPVHFMSFTATKVNQTVALRWQVSNEINSDHYIVEYSQDGIHYSTLTTVTAHNSASSTYQYLHASPSLKNINYYRITQVDKNGRTATSIVQTAKFVFSNIITVTPNPAISFVKVFSTIPNIRLYVYDAAGKRVVAQVMKDNNAQISMSSLSKGVYTVVAVDSNGKHIDETKIIKQ